MMKRIRFCALICAVLLGLQTAAVSAFAKDGTDADVSGNTETEESVCISPAIRVLAARTTM